MASKTTEQACCAVGACSGCRQAARRDRCKELHRIGCGRIARPRHASHAIAMTMGNIKWGFWVLLSGGVLGLPLACGGATSSASPSATRIQTVVIEGGFTCPQGLAPAYRQGDVGICSDQPIGVSEIPCQLCVDAGLDSCDGLEPVTVTDLERGAPLGDAVSPGAANCGDFDIQKLVAASSFQNCDEFIGEPCSAGTHIDFSPERACAYCAEDTEDNRTCGWASACFEPFIQTVAHTSGAKSCSEDSDCVGLTVDAGCGSPVSLAVNPFIDEEITWIARQYTLDNCRLCSEASSGSESFPNAETACIDGVCQWLGRR